jgi:7,8-dihydropterin-6-yl-methyl-4-(beta-D-ribofuranosyl)aminobenzene 5'-phosphate synthase
VIEKMKLTVLVDDSKNPLKPNIVAKHGLSFLIETKKGDKETTVLLDTGPSPDVILHNTDEMNLGLSKIKALLLSHGHYDHAGGLIGVLKRIRKQTIIIAHPRAFDPKFAYDPCIKSTSPIFGANEVMASGGALLLAKNPVRIADGITSSGEVERHSSFEKVKGFWTVRDETFTKDNMIDDQSLIVSIKGKGLAILAGCAHSGIVNTVKRAQKVTGIRSIHAIVGGFHLKGADQESIKSTVDELLRFEPKIIGPCHCTGTNAINTFTEVFGNRCKPLRVGDTLEL